MGRKSRCVFQFFFLVGLSVLIFLHQGGSRTNLHILFTLYSTTPSSSIRIAIRSLLQSSLGTSVLFQHDPEELGLWLDSLPCHIQDSPVDDFKDDAGSGLIGFLDECAQRCFKTPYKYIEDLQQLRGKPPTFSENQDVDMVTSTGTTVEVDESSLLLTHPETYPSPLLVTLLSQLPHKVNRLQDQTQDDLIKEILPIVSFIQQLIWKLTSKVERLGILWACFGMVEDCFRNGELSSEVKRIGDGLKTLQNPPVLQENELFDHSPLDGISLWTAANIKLKYPYVKEKYVSSRWIFSPRITDRQE